MNKKTISTNNSNSAFLNKHRLEVLKKTIADCTRRIKNNLDNPIGYYRRGIAYISTKQLDLAIADFTEAIRLNASIPAYYYFRGIAFKESGKYTSAMADFNQAIALKNDDYNNYHKRGSLYQSLYSLTNSFEQKHLYLNKALDDFKKAMELSPRQEHYQQLSENFARLISDFIWDYLQR